MNAGHRHDAAHLTFVYAMRLVVGMTNGRGLDRSGVWRLLNAQKRTDRPRVAGGIRYTKISISQLLAN